MAKNKLNIKILSVGGRGANILERLDLFDKQGVVRIAVGINGKVFSRIKIKEKIELRKNENINNINETKDIIENIDSINVKEENLLNPANW